VKRVVNRLLSSIPEHSLIGLKLIVLTNINALNRKTRRELRGKKEQSVKWKGWYDPSGKNHSAKIELLVDIILRPFSKTDLYLSLMQDFIFSDVLYHEIGHHIHLTTGQEHRKEEVVAEQWKRKLFRRHFIRKYWYAYFLLVSLKPIIRFFQKKSGQKA